MDRIFAVLLCDPQAGAQAHIHHHASNACRPKGPIKVTQTISGRSVISASIARA